MSLRKWLYLFWTTMAIGGVAAIAVGAALQLSDQDFGFMGLSGMSFNLFLMLLGGLMFSIISQMGFFAYLTINYIAMSIFKSKAVWLIVQIVLIAVAVVDLGYLNYLNFDDNSTSGLKFVILPVLFLLGGLVIAYWKSKATNSTAFIPTLLFMTAGTIIESIPSLQQDNWATVLFMGFPLFCCNAWQILQLHKILRKKELPQ